MATYYMQNETLEVFVVIWDKRAVNFVLYGPWEKFGGRKISLSIDLWLQ